MEHEADADTLRWRERESARGMVLREGHTYTATGVRHWQITISRAGRIDQQDVIVDGVLWRTNGPRSVRRWLGRSPW